MKKTLVINPFGIGDVLFTTPVIRNIKDNWENSFIGYWCNERVKDILKDNPCIDKIFPLSRGDIKKIYYRSKWEGIRKSLALFLDLKKEKFNLVLDYSLDHRYGLVSKLIGAQKRIGFNYKNRGRFLTEKKELLGYSEKHVVEYYLELLQFINIEPKRRCLELYLSRDAKIRIKALFSKNGIREDDLLIGIAPGAGASWGIDAPLKHWPAENFAQLADRVINQHNAKVFILGDAAERTIADKIIKIMHNKAIDLVGKTSLEELAAIIDNLQILVTNDGGPLHIAVALKKKTLSFFGPVDPNVYGPYPVDKRQHLVLRKATSCSPCYNNFRLSECFKHRECLEKIDLSEAFLAVEALL